MSDVKLYHGDCLDILKTLDNNSINLTVTSPPYDNLRTYNGNINQWSFEKFKSIADELYRITTDGGCVVWVVGDAVIDGSETGSSFRQALYFKEIGFNLHDTMIWHKLNPMPLDTRIPRYWQAFEFMFILSKGRPNHFHFIRDNTKSHRLSQFHQRLPNGELHDQRYEATKDNIVKDDKPLGNVWSMNTCMSNTERTGHPAQFPLQLAHDHIISWSNEEDTVLDCFLGSGTTGVAAVETNRNFIGIEIDKEYYDLAESRILQAQKFPGTVYKKPKLTDSKKLF